MMVVTRNAHEPVVVEEDKELKRLRQVTELSVDCRQSNPGFDSQDVVSLVRLEDLSQLRGNMQADQLLAQQVTLPVASGEHRWDAIPQPGPHCWPAAAVGEFV